MSLDSLGGVRAVQLDSGREHHPARARVVEAVGVPMDDRGRPSVAKPAAPRGGRAREPRPACIFKHVELPNCHAEGKVQATGLQGTSVCR